MYDRDLHEIHVHIFTAAILDKLEMKDQIIQTETVESKDEQVQAESRAQEQGMLLLNVKTASLAVLLFMMH